MRFLLALLLAWCALAAGADGPVLVPDAEVTWREPRPASAATRGSR